ncbi:MAG: PAS domain-containing protein [Gammaproteobacteria bacterium]|nr:PAS domain-containing protein [Gammaproteobacteria bacterium]
MALAKLGYFVWDGNEKRTLSCTEELAQIHGVSAEEYIASTDSLEALSNWIHPDDRAHYFEVTEQAKAVQSGISTEYRIIARHGWHRGAKGT